MTAQPAVSLPASKYSSIDTVVILFAWLVTLLVSELSAVLWRELAGSPPPAWLIVARFGVMLVALVLLFTWQRVSPLRNYFILLFLLQVALWGMSWFLTSSLWLSWAKGQPWGAGMLAIQGLKLGITLAMIAALFLLKFHRLQAFLVKGELNATAEPVRWLGMKKPTSWKTFGMIVAVVTFLGGLLFLWLTSPVSVEMVNRALRVLPVVVLLCALNAFNEEVAFRSAVLAPVHQLLGKGHALWITSIPFGLAHFSGTFPGGEIWFLLTAFLGYLFAKGMLETKGFTWPWLMHFVSDLPVLTFTAMITIAQRGF